MEGSGNGLHQFIDSEARRHSKKHIPIPKDPKAAGLQQQVHAQVAAPNNV